MASIPLMYAQEDCELGEKGSIEVNKLCKLSTSKPDGLRFLLFAYIFNLFELNMVNHLI